MKRTSFLYILLILMASLFIVGCKQETLPKQGILSITIENGISKDINVTEVPMDTKSYSIEIKDSNGKVVEAKTDKSAFETVLNIGTYEVKVTALNEKSSVIGEGSTKVTIDANTENKCTVAVKERDGKGTLVYDITNNGEKLAIEILSTDITIDIEATENGKKGEIELEKGTYTVKIKPGDGSEEISKTVRIVAEYETTLNYTHPIPEQGFLSLSIENNIAEENNVSGISMDTKSYLIEIIDSSGKEVVREEVSKTAEIVSKSYVLNTGTYKVKVTAHNEDSVIIGEGVTEVDILQARQSNCSITINEIAGKGTLSYTINSKEDLTIKILSNEAEIKTAEIKASNDTTTGSIKLNNGIYTVQIVPADGSAEVTQRARITTSQETTLTYDYTLPTPEISLTLDKAEYNTDDTELIVTASIIGIVAEKYNYEWYIGSDKVTPEKTETGYKFDISDFTEANYELKLIIKRNDLYKFEKSIAFEVVPATTAKDLLDGKSVFSTVTATLNEETTNLLIGLSFNGESISAKGSNTTISSFSGSATKETYTTIFTATETVGADTISMDFELSFTPNLNDNTVLITGEAKTNEGTEMVATLNGTVPLIDKSPSWLTDKDFYFYDTERKELSFIEYDESSVGEYSLGIKLEQPVALGITVSDNTVTLTKDYYNEDVHIASKETITKTSDSYLYSQIGKKNENGTESDINVSGGLNTIDKVPSWLAEYDFLNFISNEASASSFISNSMIMIEGGRGEGGSPLCKVDRTTTENSCEIALYYENPEYDSETDNVKYSKFISIINKPNSDGDFPGTYSFVALDAEYKKIGEENPVNGTFTNKEISE